MPLRISNQLRLWPWIWLRGAGFPSSQVLKLEAEHAAQALDAVLLAEKAFEVALRSLAEVVALEIEKHTAAARKPFAKVLKKARKGVLAEFSEPLEPVRPHYETAEATLSSLKQAEKAYAQAFSEDQERVYEQLREVAQAPQFREAVAWQNPQGLRTGIEKIATNPAGKYQRLVANYLQRYCTKNDQIGFFGPIGWGRVVEGAGSVVPGETLLSKREVFFSYWAVATLAAVLSEEFALKKKLAPRLAPTVSIQETQLEYGVDSVTTVPEAISWLLTHADGSATAEQIASAACSAGNLDFADEDEVYETLEQLEERGLLYWQLEIPPLLPHPEAVLRTALEAAGDAGEPGLAALSNLERHKTKLANAAGNANEVATALEALSQAFLEATNTPATRNAGAAYGARTPVFEDCVRNVEVALPLALFKSIGPALELVTTSARWCSHDVATKYRAVFDKAYDELGASPVRFSAFYHAIADEMPTMFGEGGGLVADSIAELKARWQRVLGTDDTKGCSEIHVSSDDIRAALNDEFAAPGPGWPGARFHCPDLLFASPNAPTPESNSELLVVLGELHATTFSVFANCGAHGWPDLEHALAAYEADSPAHIEAVIPKALADRASGYSMSGRDLHLELGESYSMRSRDNVLQVSDLLVSRRNGNLVIHSKDERHSFDVIAFFEYTLGHSIGSRFGIAAGGTHTPRIRIDNLVVARESWSFSVEELPFTNMPRGAEQFASAGRWRAHHGLPRWVFAKASGERKPTFVDMESPITIEILCNQLRKSERVGFSEMLPSLDQSWLRDAENNRYVSEVRTVVVDDMPWTPPISNPPPETS